MNAADVTRSIRTLGATCLFSFAALAAQAWSSGAHALGVQVTCTGTLPNGWTFAAESLDGRFLHIIWTGTQGQTRVSVLTFYATNADDFPVFAGTLQDALEIALVDMSAGAPATGTGIMVHSEEWGWHQGTCRQLGGETPADVLSAEVIRQNLVGTRDTSARNWLRRNDFTFVRVVESTGAAKTERWQQNPSYPIDVAFDGSIVSDVIAAGE